MVKRPSSATELELLVQRIQRQLAPKATVRHNEKLPGRHTGSPRQIDVLVSENVGQYEINIVIDCKDHKKPVDVKGVEEFAGLLDDVGAQKGVLVCPSGFSEMAKRRAEKLQIDLYSPLDTEPHKWQVKTSIRALCDIRRAAVSFGIRGKGEAPRITDGFFSEAMVFNASHEELGTCAAAIAMRWNADEFADNPPGITDEFLVFPDTQTHMIGDRGNLVAVTLTATLRIEPTLYYGQLPIPRISGFLDQLKGQVITNAFEVGLLDPDEVERCWTRVKTEQDIPGPKPVIRLAGIVEMVP